MLKAQDSIQVEETIEFPVPITDETPSPPPHPRRYDGADDMRSQCGTECEAEFLTKQLTFSLYAN